MIKVDIKADGVQVSDVESVPGVSSIIDIAEGNALLVVEHKLDITEIRCQVRDPNAVIIRGDVQRGLFFDNVDAALKVGATISKLREKRGMSASKLARIIRVSHSTILSWESGGVDFTLSRLIEIAEAFDMNLMTFLIAVEYGEETFSENIPTRNYALTKRHSNNAAAKQLLFERLQVGDIVYYSAGFLLDDVIEMANSYGVGVEYCRPGSPEYKKLGDRVVKVVSIRSRQ